MKKRIIFTLPVVLLFSLLLSWAATTADEKPALNEYKGITAEQEAEARTWFTEEELRLLEESGTSIEKMYNQGDANMLYKKLQAVLGPEMYGGMYVDDNGNLGIYYIPENEQTVREAAESNKGREDQFFTLLPARYSYRELMEVLDGLLEMPDELLKRLRYGAIDQMQNRLIVGIAKSMYNEVTFNEIRDYFGTSCIMFIESPEIVFFEDC